ncbi:MAG: hypothetical protein R3E89_04930 [Thiolinea sp.]
MPRAPGPCVFCDTINATLSGSFRNAQLIIEPTTYTPPPAAPDVLLSCKSGNLTSGWTTSNPSSSNAGAIGAQITTTASSGASWNAVSNGAMNTINAWSDTAVQGRTSWQSVFNWDTNPETGGELASDDMAPGTITFSWPRPVTNPLIHIDRFGGNGGITPPSGTQYNYSNSMRFVPTTPGATLVRSSGPPHFEVTTEYVQRIPNVRLVSNSDAESTLDPIQGTAAGTFGVLGTFSSLSFDVQGVGLEGAGGDGIEVVMCVPQSDVSLTQTVSNDQPAIGDTVTITLTVNNAAGGDMTTGLQVTDLLPAGLNFVSANPEQGTYDNNTGVWDIGAIDAGISRTLIITASVTASGELVNDAVISNSGLTDMDALDNVGIGTDDLSDGVADDDETRQLPPISYAGTNPSNFVPDSDPSSTTDPLNPDTDAGGVCDGSRTVAGVCIAGEDLNNNGALDSGETDPNIASNDPLDSDGDSLTDPLERELGTDPNDPDTDGDGLTDGEEDANGSGVTEAGETNPLDADSDDDGLSDGAEDTNGNGVVDAGETDPLNPDSDQDGLQDGTEQGVTTPIAGGTSDGGTPVSYAGTDNATFIPDSDPASTTDPLNPDTDQDGLQDGTELGVTTPIASGGSEGGTPVSYTGTNPSNFVPDSDPGSTTDPLNPDTDAGGVCDGSLTVTGVCVAGEDLNNNGALDSGETDPNIGSNDPLDSDGDGLTDPLELELGTDPNDPDTDNDGLPDGVEDANGNGVIDVGETNPLDADSDDDGLSDGAEDANGNGVVDAGETDPLNPDSDQDGLQDGTELGVTTPISGGSSDGSTPVSYAGTDPATFIPDRIRPALPIRSIRIPMPAACVMVAWR